MPSQKIRWLHLSDFHFGKDGYGTRKTFDKIIEHVAKRKQEGFVPDFIFITGDLANKGLDSEYTDFWLEFVVPLQLEIGNRIEERTFVVPGNHDVDRDHNQAFSREEISDPKSHHFDPTEEGQRLRGLLMPRFRSFENNDQTVSKAAFGKKSGAFSNTLDVNGIKIGIAGVNTAWLSKDKFDEKTLTPGFNLLEAALKNLDEAKLKIVLGHHPIDWFIREQQKPIKSLLGQHSVIYLHGHLHEIWAEPTNGSGYEFLAVQCGAGFQAREGEIWRSGLVWGLADLESSSVHLQPWKWNYDNQNWALASEVFPESLRQETWWIYPLPGTGIAKHVVKTQSTVIIQAPKGWDIAKPGDLRKHLVPLEDGVAIKFFNGAVPGWQMALSTSIPRRAVVRAIVSNYADADSASRSIVTLILAAGCEGKTTAMLQAAYNIVSDKPEWRILRRVDDAELLKPAELLKLLDKSFRWLVILDEADRVAESIVTFLGHLPPEHRGRVHFLIACRDSDWQASRAYDLNWASACIFKQERLAGLNETDARVIVNAWANFGKEGLGDLAGVPENKRAVVLCQQALEEAKTAKGAFFGALLSVRHGSDLPNHARLMLERLGQC